MPGKTKKPKNNNRQLRQQAQLHDDLAEFEEFRREILPMLRKDIEAGMSAEDMYAKYQAHAAARGITIAMTAADEGKALAAVKDILDRSQGRAIERKENVHRFDKLSDEELDAMLLTEMDEKDVILEDEG
jgi:hypothetical protein